MLHPVLCNSVSLLSQRSCNMGCGKHEATASQEDISDLLAAGFDARGSHIKWEERNDGSSFCFTLRQTLRSGWMDQSLSMETEQTSLVSVSHSPAADSPPSSPALLLPWLAVTQVDTEPDKSPSFTTFSAVSIAARRSALKEASQVVAKIFPLLTYFQVLSRNTFRCRTQNIISFL